MGSSLDFMFDMTVEAQWRQFFSFLKFFQEDEIGLHAIRTMNCRFNQFLYKTYQTIEERVGSKMS